MRIALSKREYMWMGKGPVSTHDHPIGYEVEQMPPGYQAWINNFGAPNRDDWKILIVRNGVSRPRFGEYANAAAALAAIRGYIIEFVN